MILFIERLSRVKLVKSDRSITNSELRVQTLGLFNFKRAPTSYMCASQCSQHLRHVPSNLSTLIGDNDGDDDNNNNNNINDDDDVNNDKNNL